MSPLIVGVIAFFSTTWIHVAGGVVVGAEAINQTSSEVFAAVQTACPAADATMDSIQDIVDNLKNKNKKITFWRRLSVDTTAAADTICAASNKPNTFLNRIGVVAKAIDEVVKANKALNATKPQKK